MEQRSIVAGIRSQHDRIDAILERNNDLITKLREYRQALISAAVTGKFAVPQEVPS